jgi:hypothetical protein
MKCRGKKKGKIRNLNKGEERFPTKGKACQAKWRPASQYAHEVEAVEVPPENVSSDIVAAA